VTAQGSSYTVQSRATGEGGTNAVVAPAGTTVRFNGVGRVTSGAVNFDVTNPAGGACESSGGPMRCLRIQVGVGGEVRMCNPSLPSSDPRGC
jgi:type IV fimbrial biogenesis protein FimT